eukprot:CAMPEP_0202979208 /NCGR_PEP_ID=MMETSP1396-20130829/85427_1 /ASSEMBLY_ACC=CAM_ASM_000872 /TAXON_ID= /ORGANISM="Pseudokeronopsis sp., Strain Brazil" /LENGTH=31 /DNA_ID= /DNA_START= /DNA_END= /DNA_ORIENTATION=
MSVMVYVIEVSPNVIKYSSAKNSFPAIASPM